MRTPYRSGILIVATNLALALSIPLAISQQVPADKVEKLEQDCPYSVDRFIAELRNEDTGRRWLAAECLGEIKDPRAVVPLVQAVLSEHIPRLGLVETNSLKQLDDPRTEEILLGAINDEQTRRQAINALGRLQAKRAVEPLIAILKNPDRSTTAVAAGALAEIKGPRALQPLCELLKNRDEVIRRYAAQSLGILGDPKAGKPLAAALNDVDDGVRWNAADSLGELKDIEAVPALVKALKDSEEGVRAAAADSLGKIGDARAVAPLVIALTAGKGRTRWHAASALAKFSTPEAAAALDSSLRRRELDVVAAAYSYFLLRKDTDSIEAMVAAMNKNGWYEMAAAMRDSGDPRLADAARQWESRNGVELQPER